MYSVSFFVYLVPTFTLVGLDLPIISCYVQCFFLFLGFNLYFQAQGYRDNSDFLSIEAPEIEATEVIRVIMGSQDK